MALDSLLDLFFPPSCAACEVWLQTEGPFCAVCTDALHPPDGPRCSWCARPWAGSLECPACRLEAPAFDSTHAAFLYGGPLLEAIHRLKYRRASHLAEPLGRMLADSLPQTTAAVEAVVPVPLHPGRLRERGFDQAERLAVPVARRLRRPLLAGALRRVGERRSQVGLGAGARRRNIRGVFEPAWPMRWVRGRRVLLVDDVLTTGATARAAAGALLGAGACSVRVAVLARSGD